MMPTEDAVKADIEAMKRIRDRVYEVSTLLRVHTVDNFDLTENFVKVEWVKYEDTHKFYFPIRFLWMEDDEILAFTQSTGRYLR